MGIHMAKRWHSSNFTDEANALRKQMIDRLSELVEEVESEVGHVDAIFNPISVTQAWPQRYAVYLVPIGKQDYKPKAIADKFAEFYGARVAVLPEVMPSDEARERRTLYKGELSYDVEVLWQDVLPRIEIPADALYVMLFSSEHYHADFTHGKPWCENGSGNPLLLGKRSYDYFEKSPSALMGFWAISANRTDMAKRHGRANIRAELLDVERCAFPCLFYRRIDGSNMEGSNLACAKCQEAFRKLDFDTIHRNLMDYLRSMGATIVPAAVQEKGTLK
jgi:hypothetical protein